MNKLTKFHAKISKEVQIITKRKFLTLNIKKPKKNIISSKNRDKLNFTDLDDFDKKNSLFNNSFKGFYKRTHFLLNRNYYSINIYIKPF